MWKPMRIQYQHGLINCNNTFHISLNITWTIVLMLVGDIKTVSHFGLQTNNTQHSTWKCIYVFYSSARMEFDWVLYILSLSFLSNIKTWLVRLLVVFIMVYDAPNRPFETAVYDACLIGWKWNENNHRKWNEKRTLTISHHFRLDEKRSPFRFVRCCFYMCFTLWNLRIYGWWWSNTHCMWKRCNDVEFDAVFA